MNQKNNEGFTPLIYASYSGHIDIIKYLVEEFHVDEKIVTNTGLNPLHLAAQKNMVMPFLYFRGRINLDDVDDLDRVRFVVIFPLRKTVSRYCFSFSSAATTFWNLLLPTSWRRMGSSADERTRGIYTEFSSPSLRT